MKKILIPIASIIACVIFGASFVRSTENVDCFRRGYTFWSDSLSLWNSCLRRKRQTMIETIIVYLAGGALAIALFFVLVARIVRLITGKDLLNKKFPFIRDITNKMFLIGITFAVVYVLVMAFI